VDGSNRTATRKKQDLKDKRAQIMATILQQRATGPNGGESVYQLSTIAYQLTGGLLESARVQEALQSLYETGTERGEGLHFIMAFEECE
jgi:hypothetical protein